MKSTVTNPEQGTAEWHQRRAGKFTASSIMSLLIGGRDKNSIFGEVAIKYIFSKAVEIFVGLNEEDSFVTFDTQRGINLEPMAFRKFQEIKEVDFISVEKCSFFAYGENAVASPDGLVGDDATLEIKCPKPDKFFNLVLNGIDAIDPVYIAQMQMQMLCTNSKRCHFFNYIIYNGVEMWHEIVVERDEDMISKIKDRIEKAIIIRDEFVEQLRKKAQF